ncbi:MAG: hypothetical protein P1U85_20355 [Verrucomicrobiales bacterium]|nr:hypothetical protein [Verrucomicrobiales bacterium]
MKQCAKVGGMEVPKTIVCVDCGETAHLISYPPEEGWAIGDYVAYRCRGCNDRWDLVVSEEDQDSPAPTHPTIAEEARAILAARRENSSD